MIVRIMNEGSSVHDGPLPTDKLQNFTQYRLRDGGKLIEV